ncbi:phage terminase large subunit [Aquisediminimonas sediminicola]|uniref:phage terminase large subunit n=1 Tax=Alteraquisediminimonas sediminicola TaxID=2676787 RepID=UPI001C8EE479|nr:phage terminase large subunit [Aquisediminimonas sediminicola]
MVARSEVAAALARQRLLPMLMFAFAMHHPGAPPLEPSWYIQAMCHWLERVAKGELRRSMIWIQPRTLKSFTVAVVFPCWLLGRNPSARIMVATYGGTLARDHAIKRRQIMDSDWYRQLFPRTQLADRGNRDGDLNTTDGGYCICATVGGPVTGRGADFILLDDCMKAEDETSDVMQATVKRWFSSTLSTRRNDKRTSSILSIQQRISEDDLPAYLLTKGYDCLSLPAFAGKEEDIAIGEGIHHHRKRGDLLDPVRFPKDVLDEERLNLGPQAYEAQYMQNPVAPAGNLLKMDQFRRFEQPIPRERFDRVIQSWDPAASELPTADWSVCTTWGMLADRLFLLHIWRARVDYPGLKRAVISQHHVWNADHVIIERSSNGLPLWQQLTREGPFQPVAWPPNGIRQLDKAERLIAQTGQIEEGRVWIPAALDGLDTFLMELRAFPNSRYDDQVDTLTQVLEYLFWRWRQLAKEYTSSGRPKASVRGKRPPLPPLPDFLL